MPVGTFSTVIDSEVSMDIDPEDAVVLQAAGVDLSSDGAYAAASDGSESEGAMCLGPRNSDSESEGPVVFRAPAAPIALPHASDGEGGSSRDGLRPLAADDSSTAGSLGANKWAPGHDVGD